MAPSQDTTYRGNCVCGRYRYELCLSDVIQAASSCTCSVCVKKGYLWLVPPEGSFKVIRDDGCLREHTSKAITHKVCSVTYGSHTIADIITWLAVLRPLRHRSSGPAYYGATKWSLHRECTNHSRCQSISNQVFSFRKSWFHPFKSRKASDLRDAVSQLSRLKTTDPISNCLPPLTQRHTIYSLANAEMCKLRFLSQSMNKRLRKTTAAVVSGYPSPIVPWFMPYPDTDTFGSRKLISEYTQQKTKFESTAERRDGSTVD